MSFLSSRLFECFTRQHSRTGSGRRHKSHLVHACQSEVLESRQLLTQIITATANNIAPAVDEQVEVTVKYSTTDLAAAQSQSLGLKMYFNSNELEFVGFKSGTFELDGKQEPANILAAVPGDDSVTNGDADASTDKFINAVWNVPQGNWPATVDATTGTRTPRTLPSALYVALFKVKTGFNGEKINFGVTPQGGQGNTFLATPVELSAPGGPKQIVTPTVNVPKIGIDQTFEVTIPYNTTDLAAAQSQSLGLKMYFNSQELQFVGFKTGTFELDGKQEPANILAPDLGDDSVTNGDGSTNTDKFINAVWNVPQGNWPANVDAATGTRTPKTLPSPLYVAVFKTLTGFDGETINFTGSAQGGAAFNSTAATIELGGVTTTFDFDIDGNGVRNAFQDAAILAAWMLGSDITDADFQKLIPANAAANLNTVAKIKAHLDGSQALFDVDGNGVRNAFQDAAILAAWMLGSDITDADFQKLIPANAAADRNTVAEIKTYLNNLQGVASPAAASLAPVNIVITPQPVIPVVPTQPLVSDPGPTIDESTLLQPDPEDDPDLFNFEEDPAAASGDSVEGLDFLYTPAEGSATLPDNLLDLGL